MSPTSDVPLVSIGLPVYNGTEHLEHALCTILAQTWSNFELIISDNASTDDTAEMCRDAAARDTRIRFFRQEFNRGAAYNWNFVASQARGEFFKWASANDYHDPSFIERCVARLLAQADVVLCYTRTNLERDGCGDSELDRSDIRVMDDDPAARFIKMMHHRGRNNAQSGVIRLAPLLSTRLVRKYPHGDKVLMAELALQGKFDLIEDALFFRRWDGPASSVTSLSPSELRTFIDPSQRSDLDLDTWRRAFDLLGSAATAPLPLGRKPLLVASVLRHWVSYRRPLWKEASYTVASLVRR